MKQAQDFRDEHEALYLFVDSLDEQEFYQPTQYQRWTTEDIILHLHHLNLAVECSLEGESLFQEKYALPMLRCMEQGMSMLEAQKQSMPSPRGRALIDVWREEGLRIADKCAQLPTKTRLSWFGPPMSIRSAMTARQMETWAHGQAIYDRCGVHREEHERLQNIARFGVLTIPFAFQNRGETPPPHRIYVSLRSPKGELWEWNSPDSPDVIEGSAMDFCHVVTQTRHLQDTQLAVEGDFAKRWGQIAQCFAGPPIDPPVPGTRFCQES